MNGFLSCVSNHSLSSLGTLPHSNTSNHKEIKHETPQRVPFFVTLTGQCMAHGLLSCDDNDDKPQSVSTTVRESIRKIQFDKFQISPRCVMNHQISDDACATKQEPEISREMDQITRQQQEPNSVYADSYGVIIPASSSSSVETILGIPSLSPSRRSSGKRPFILQH